MKIFQIINKECISKLRGYSLIRDSRNVIINNPYIHNLAKEYDDIGYMSEEVGKELDRLFDDPNYAIGIHRTGYTRVNNKVLKDSIIF